MLSFGFFGLISSSSNIEPRFTPINPGLNPWVYGLKPKTLLGMYLLGINARTEESFLLVLEE
jgi:hypothetical protein